MATLIKRPNSPFWIACFDVPQADGTTRRLKQSTKRTKKSEAHTEALRIEEAATKSATSTSETAGKSFAVLTEAAEAAARGELSEGRARELLARLCEISTGSPLRFYTVRTWRNEWLAMKAATSKPATLARYKTHVDAFVDWLGEKADSKLEAVTKADVRSFRDAIRGGWTAPDESTAPTASGRKSSRNAPAPPPRTAKTTNLYAADVASMLRHAVKDGLLTATPAAAMARLPEHDSTERQVFTVAEVGQLVTAAGNMEWQNGVFAQTDKSRAARCLDWQGMILLGFYAGARLGDCAGLTWGAVDLDRKALCFMPAKTERKRKALEVPLHPRLVSWLKGRTRGPDETPLFPTLCKCHIGGGHGLSSQFIAIMDVGKIDRRTTRVADKGLRAQHARSFHALRHSLTSVLANLDVSEEIRRRIVGHESAEVHAGYTHTERETLQRAVEKMPSV
ncbi:MAG: tyrosine-type recombinase/integrase [Verrucomicrobiota bacterium]